MSGIYVHIPFCRKACHYCNFHFSTNTKLVDSMVDAIYREIELRKDYLGDDSIETIYFGGGTPSVLSLSQIEYLIEGISKNFTITHNPEITLEANPDDLSKSYLKKIRLAGVNRLSIGVQSFFQDELEWMNRSHNSDQAEACIFNALDIGFKDITVDLIFGLPVSSTKRWLANLDKLSSFNVPHLSCYGLTVEPRTALKKMIEKGKTAAPDEGQYSEQFQLTRLYLEEKGYKRYEISNYAKDERYSRHNTAYWQGKSYIGLGPAAHSFNGHSRQWNISNNPLYIKSIEAGDPVIELEELSTTDLFNEYLLTGLRTIWGCQGSKLKEIAQDKIESFQNSAELLIRSGHLIYEQGTYTLSEKGMVMANSVISELFLDS